MDCESAGKHIEPHRIVYQYERNEKHQGDEHSQHHRYSVEIGIEGIHQGFLIDDLIHHRGLHHRLLHYLQAVPGHVIGIQGDNYGDRNRRSLENGEKVGSEHLGHLLLTPGLGDEFCIAHESHRIDLILENGGLFVGNLLLHHYRNLEILLEEFGYAAGIDQKHCRHADKQQHQADAHDRRQIGVHQTAAHKFVLVFPHN